MCRKAFGFIVMVSMHMCAVDHGSWGFLGFPWLPWSPWGFLGLSLAFGSIVVVRYALGMCACVLCARRYMHKVTIVP